MDHRAITDHKTETKAKKGFDPYVIENGERFMVPYRVIKMAVFSDVSKEEMLDMQHAARLQYRLMLPEPILKATVDFTRSKITVVYNPDTADNGSPKMSLRELVELLKKEGITVHPSKTSNDDYDYYREFYSRAYNPPSVRENAPYGYTLEQWRKLKPAWEEKIKNGEVEKHDKFMEFQHEYLAEMPPEMAKQLDPNFKASDHAGKARKKSQGKGFWFHGA